MMYSPIYVSIFPLHIDVLFSLFFFAPYCKLHLLSSLHLSEFQLFQSLLAVKNLGAIKAIESIGQGKALVYLKISHAITTNELLKFLLTFRTYNFHLVIMLRNSKL